MLSEAAGSSVLSDPRPTQHHHPSACERTPTLSHTPTVRALLPHPRGLTLLSLVPQVPKEVQETRTQGVLLGNAQFTPTSYGCQGWDLASSTGSTGLGVQHPGDLVGLEEEGTTPELPVPRMGSRPASCSPRPCPGPVPTAGPAVSEASARPPKERLLRAVPRPRLF